MSAEQSKAAQILYSSVTPNPLALRGAMTMSLNSLPDDIVLAADQTVQAHKAVAGFQEASLKGRPRNELDYPLPMDLRLGNITTPEELLDECMGAGIAVPNQRDTLKELKRHEENGQFGGNYFDRLACARRLETNDSSLKDLSYYAFLSDMVDFMKDRNQDIPDDQYIFMIDSYITDFVDRYGYSTHLVNKLMHNARTEFIHSTAFDYRFSRLGQEFVKTGEQFIKQLRLSDAGKKRQSIEYLDTEWNDRKSSTGIGAFYSAMYSLNYRPLIGRWSFEDLPLLLKYYEQRVTEEAPIDPYSEILLSDCRDGVEFKKTMGKLFDTGQTHDTVAQLVALHRNMITYGHYTRPATYVKK